MSVIAILQQLSYPEATSSLLKKKSAPRQTGDANSGALGEMDQIQIQ